MIINIHASAIRSMRDCADYVPSPAGDAARIGQAVHAAVAAQLRGVHVDYLATARTFGLTDAKESAREIQWMAQRCLNWYSGIACEFGFSDYPDIEYQSGIKIGNLRISGTADVVARNADGIAFVIDWKTGRADEDHHDQLMAYCRMIDPARQYMYLVYRPRDDEEDRSTMMIDADLDLWLEAVRVDLERSGVGACRACAYCGRADCEARNANIRGLAASYVGGELLDIQSASDALEKARTAKKILDRIEDEAREYLIVALRNNGGELPLENGHRAILKEETRAEYDSVKTSLVLASIMPTEDVFRCAKFSATLIKNMIAEKAKALKDAGQKITIKHAIDETESALIVGGAISEKTIRKVVIK